MIYTIPKKKKPISSCTSELESTFNSNLNSDNDDDKNNDSSFMQIGNNNNNLDLDLNPEQYIVLSDFTKEQELKWFSNNDEDIVTDWSNKLMDSKGEQNCKLLYFSKITREFEGKGIVHTVNK
ncbi:hypothetical protein G9A89_016399 [Geosiphon pyriformis]|nr:hypothetical protein G9A89_016399 [Geosiphon pyriformis]